MKTFPYCVFVSPLRRLPRCGETHLLLVREEELVGVDTIRNGTTDNREPVEDDWRLGGVLEQQLVQDIENNGDKEKGGESEGDKRRERRFRGELPQWASNFSENTHSECRDERETAATVGWIGSVRGESRCLLYFGEELGPMRERSVQAGQGPSSRPCQICIEPCQEAASGH